jgi:hypothetical protein
MARTNRARGTYTVVLGLGSLLISEVTQADVFKLDPVEPQSSSAATPITQPAAAKPLRLTLTQAELRAILAKYEKNSGQTMYGDLEEITVTAPADLLPMRDRTQEVWGGIAAPVWAVLNPTQAWRIFLPIPPD